MKHSLDYADNTEKLKIELEVVRTRQVFAEMVTYIPRNFHSDYISQFCTLSEFDALGFTDTSYPRNFVF